MNQKKSSLSSLDLKQKGIVMHNYEKTKINLDESKQESLPKLIEDSN